MKSCLHCHRTFRSRKALQSHYQQQQDCNDHFLKYELELPNIESPTKHILPIQCEDDTYSDLVIEHSNESDNENLNDNELFENYSFNNTLIDKTIKNRHNHHLQSGFTSMIETDALMQSQIDLLVILKQAKVPLYLFDQIWKWTKQSANGYNIDFGSLGNVSRTNCIKKLKNSFDLHGLDPIKKRIKLKGSNTEIDLIVHDFDHCLYSLLNDELLMDPDKLLIDLDFNSNPSHGRTKQIIDDIDSGFVYKKACATHINRSNKEILCPIIFFIDKTHTDVQGRLCLEQIRFTLGIFNRETRSNPNAWRTLGYITDQSYIKTKNSFEKNQDYHHMISVILQDFKLAQSKLIEWDLMEPNELKWITVFFRLLVLFIIGDTDGQDKLAGRYTSRNGIQKPCRYCDTSFDDTDDPETVYNYNKHSLVCKTIDSATFEELQSLSVHGIDNAWKDVLFCDSDRGLYGAICADILHCLHHGLFNYALQALFDRKAAKKATSITKTPEADEESENEDVPLSNRNVFTQNYSKHFDELTKKYGLYLSHQSDRDLPRTHINTNYTTITRKNANEMSGVLIAILIVFSTNEGTHKLDEALANIVAANFIHLFELLLLLENFCSSPEHKIPDVKKFKRFVPYILNTYKRIINRETGCGCKFIKFHLPNHFAEDMLRFGSMLNFDTEIGESHHKTEAKYPSKNTQRRKSEFEYQTATRQIENFAINKAFAQMTFLKNDDNKDTNKDDQNIENKWYRYRYNPEVGLQQKFDKNKYENCKWIDSDFQNQLTQICEMIYKEQCIEGELKFFSLHNRYSNIFRADPNYQSNICWYDWADVNWSNEIIPTKLLLFWDIEKNTLKKKFKVGNTTIVHPGQYVLCYSLASLDQVQPAHTTSLLVKYGKLDIDTKGMPKLYICHVDCIASTLSAVPYKVSDGNHNAIEWLFLRPKDEWYSIFLAFMNEELEKEKDQIANKKQRKN